MPFLITGKAETRFVQAPKRKGLRQGGQEGGAFLSMSTRWRANTEPLSSARRVGGPPAERRRARPSLSSGQPSQDPAWGRGPHPGLILGLPHQHCPATQVRTLLCSPRSLNLPPLSLLPSRDGLRVRRLPRAPGREPSCFLLQIEQCPAPPSASTALPLPSVPVLNSPGPPCHSHPLSFCQSSEAGTIKAVSTDLVMQIHANICK